MLSDEDKSLTYKSEIGSILNSEILYVQVAPFLPKKCTISAIYAMNQKIETNNDD